MLPFHTIRTKVYNTQISRLGKLLGSHYSARASRWHVPNGGYASLSCENRASWPATGLDRSATALRRMSQASEPMNYGKSFSNILLSRHGEHVAHLELNRPRVKNAFGLDSAREFIEALDLIEEDPTIRCLILSGNGADFTSGVDLKSFMTTYAQLQECDDVGRKAKLLHGLVRKFQAPFKRMDGFCKPIIAVQHGLCYGLGMELAACSDIRYCSMDTRYSVREVLIGIAADVGSLQKLPRLVSNQSTLRELVYTGRVMEPNEALALGFVSRIFNSKDETLNAAYQLAGTISKRSPVAVQGSKRNLGFSEDKSFGVGLDYNAIWNMSMMQSEDVVKAVTSIMSKAHEDDNKFSDY